MLVLLLAAWQHTTGVQYLVCHVLGPSLAKTLLC